MIRYFEVDDKGINENGSDYNWLLIKNSSDSENQELLKKYDLPKDLFQAVNHPAEVSRIKKYHSREIGEITSIVLFDLQESSADESIDQQKRIEKRLYPVSIILSDKLLITICHKSSNLLEEMIDSKQFVSSNFETIIAYALSDIYARFTHELLTAKERIDALDEAARKTTENQALFHLADMERDMVYLEKTLIDQDETIRGLTNNEDFVRNLNDQELLYEIEIKHRQAMKMVDLYRDLLETIGGLFSDMMDNNLNHLMKYLDSAALIISIPALITGIWGMNTGIPGENSKASFWFVIIISILLAAIAAIHLSRKDYTK